MRLSLSSDNFKRFGLHVAITAALGALMYAANNIGALGLDETTAGIALLLINSTVAFLRRKETETE
jgi:hypothetical protein